MARQTRQQRRERRAQSAPAGRRAPTPQRALAADGAGERAPAPARAAEQPRQGNAVFRFLGESWGELKKVEWPGQQQVIQGTIVVLVACLVVGAFLWANDKVWQNVIHRFLIK